MKATNVTINKMSKTGKTCLLQFKAHSRQIGYTFAWAQAMEDDEAGMSLPNFEYQGFEQVLDEADELVFYKDADGNPTEKPVLKVQF